MDLSRQKPTETDRNRQKPTMVIPKENFFVTLQHETIGNKYFAFRQHKPSKIKRKFICIVGKNFLSLQNKN